MTCANCEAVKKRLKAFKELADSVLVEGSHWVSLTDYEIAELCADRRGWSVGAILGFARAIEAKLKEKNNG